MRKNLPLAVATLVLAATITVCTSKVLNRLDSLFSVLADIAVNTGSRHR